MWEKEKTRPTVRATSEEEVDDVEALVEAVVEAVVVETNCGREAEVAVTTTWEDSEESSKDLNTLATHTPAEQGPGHHSPNLKKWITRSQIRQILIVPKGAWSKAENFFQTSKLNQTINLKSDLIIDNSKGNQQDKSNMENNQGNLEKNKSQGKQLDHS